MYLSNIIVSEKKTSLKYTICSDVNYNFDENKLREVIYICESVLEELKLKGYNPKIEEIELFNMLSQRKKSRVIKCDFGFSLLN